MKKVFVLVLLSALIGVSAFADTTTSLVVNATVSGHLSITMPTPDAFEVVDANGDLISTRTIGNSLILSNYASWKISLTSANASSNLQGRLKLTGQPTYIPYSFQLKDGDTVILSAFNTESPSQSVTAASGKSLTLIFNFVDDSTVWPQGTYQDTITLTVISG